MVKTYDTIIIGAGISGYSAALYCGRFRMKTLVLGPKGGGTIALTDHIENWPSVKKASGIELFGMVRDHAREYEIDEEDDMAKDVSPAKDGFSVKTFKGKTFEAKTVIFATGTKVRKLGIPGEAEFEGKGVHYCALCDGPVYGGATVAVVGGSDSAAREALLLAEYAKKVYIIYRKDKIRAEPINLVRVDANKKIEIIANTNVKEVHGDKFMKSVTLDKPYKGKKEFPLEALFVEIGRIPLSELTGNLSLKTNQKGEIIIDKESKTNVPGVFAAGDVTDRGFKQAITGSAEAVSAAFSAYMYVSSKSAYAKAKKS